MKEKTIKSSPEKYKKDFLNEHGYFYCEHCGRSTSPFFSVHHIVFRSELGKKQDIHNPKNLILLCVECHEMFHTHKAKRNKLVEERGLNELYNRNFKKN